MAFRWQRLIANGRIPVHIFDMPWAHSVVLAVLVKAGTRDEHWPGEAGIAHALEHMIFQGTRDFPNNQSMASYIEDVGGVINAGTHCEGTLFFVQVPAQELERAVYALSQLLICPVFPEEKIETEMQNIIQEIRMVKDDSQRYLLDLAKKSLYGEHPLGKNTLGTEESVKSFTRRYFEGFYSHYYNANNFDLIAVGHIEKEERLMELISKYFADAPDGPFNKRETTQAIGDRKNFVFENKDLEQVHIALVAPTIEGAARDARVLEVFEVMISGGMSFPLFVEVRDKLGLCYEIWADHALFSDLSAFIIYSATDPNKYQETVEAIFKVLNKSKTDAELLKKAKKRILGSLAIRYENPIRVASDAASGASIFGQPCDREDLLAEIDSISIEEVESAATKNLLYNPSQCFSFVYLAPNGLTPSQTLNI